MDSQSTESHSHGVIFMQGPTLSHELRCLINSLQDTDLEKRTTLVGLLLVCYLECFTLSF